MSKIFTLWSRIHFLRSLNLVIGTTLVMKHSELHFGLPSDLQHKFYSRIENPPVLKFINVGRVKYVYV
jgi:hypothetical protein